MNGPSGRTANLCTERRFGDIELYLEFMLAKGSNSGIYLHGLYEIQIFDSWGSTEPLKTADAGGIYHQWIDERGVGGAIVGLILGGAIVGLVHLLPNRGKAKAAA